MKKQLMQQWRSLKEQEQQLVMVAVNLLEMDRNILFI